MTEFSWQIAFEQMRAGLALAEGEALLVRQANAAFWSILEVAPANRDTFMLLTRLGNDEPTRRWVRAVLAGQPQATELRQPLADGSHRHLEITARPAGTDNQVFIEVRDLTPQEDLREELQQALARTAIPPEQKTPMRLAGLEADRKGILRSFYAITATQSLALQNKFRELLRLGMDLLKLDEGQLLQVGKEKYIVLEAVSRNASIERFVELDPEHSYCSEVVRLGELVCFENASVTDWRLSPAYGRCGMEAFMGAPVRVNNEVFGALSFTSSQPRQAPFSQDDEEIVRLLAQWIGSEMERQQQIRQLQGYSEQIRKNNLALAEARDQALEAGRIKSEFLTTISHEIRTPMNAVIGMSNLLMQTPLNPEQQEYLGIVLSSAESLLHLFNDLLAYSQLEAGRAKLEETTFDPADLQAQIAGQYRLEARARNLSLTDYAAAEIPPKVRGDAQRIEQVLKALVDNAIKFTQSGGVSMRLIVVRREGNTVWLEYRVTDTGIGISKAAQNRLFQPFSQVEGGTSRKFGGMGLGLAICRRQAELLGGEISVQSVEGKGASFWMKIPLVDVAAAPPEPDEAATSALSRLHALIASDRLDRLTVMSEFLQGWGVTVHEMTYGEALAAMEGALDFEIHLALLDTPDSGSLHLMAARRLRQQRGLSDLPIGLVIDSEQQSDSISSRDGAFQMLLELPVKQTDLLELTSRATQRLIRKTDIVDAGAPVKKSVPAFSGEVTAEGELRPGAGQGNLLLAQGDPAVLRVLTDQLEDLGYRVKSVSNGRQVLEALLAEPDRYTLVLIGRKLPGMDGINTVRLARKTEMTHKMRIPLVGLLTPDEQSERHAFLEAGLDELIVLPFVAQKHAALLERLAVPHLRSRALSKGGEVRVGQAPLDESYLQGLRQLEKGNEPGLVNDLFKSYLDSTPGLIAKARHALRTPGSPELRQAVHSLRGTSGNLGAHQLARICGDLEQAAEGKDTALMMELFHRLEAEFARVRTAMLKEIKS